jgi:phospholipid transport system transporter-binding protein
MFALPAVLTLNEATACVAQLRQAMAGSPSAPVLIDASALRRFDSAALAVLLDCRRQCAAAGKAFSVSGMAPRLMALATLYGVEGLLPAP